MLLNDDEDPIGVVKLMVQCESLVTVRFATEQSKIDYLEKKNDLFKVKLFLCKYIFKLVMI